LTGLRGLQKSILTTPAFVLVIYGTVEWLGLNGAIAALMIGITLGNIKELPPVFLKERRDLFATPTETESAVFEEVAFLLKTFFFVYVGISIRLEVSQLIWAGLATACALFIVRIPVVHASFIPKASFSRFEAALSGAMNPKGLSAAVMASIPLQKWPEELHPQATKIQMVVFAVVLFSTLIASMLIFLVERGWFNGLGRALYGRFKPDQPE
jgi:NhaP-type Na+/H+ or K+/H+ antiporter